MRALLAVLMLLVTGCNGPQSAVAAPDRPASPQDALTQPRSRSEILRAMRRLERLASLSDGCGLNERIVIAIITRVGATLFIGGMQHRLTPADRARAIEAGMEDAKGDRAAGRAPDCVQVGAELVAMARQYAAVPPRATRPN